MDPTLPILPPGGPPMVPAPESPKSVRDAAQQFEAILLSYLIRGLRQTIPTAEGAPFTRGFYEDLMDTYMASHLAKSGGIGLAKLIEASVPDEQADPPQPDAGPLAGPPRKP